MLKNFLACVLFLPTLVMANLEQSLVGKWECKGVEDEYFHYTSDIEYRDNGILSEKSIIYKWGKDDDFYQIDTIKALSKWQVMGDKIRYYDNIVQSYAVDMPNYNSTDDFPKHSKDSILIAKSIIERANFEKEMADEMMVRIRFIDKDTYISAFEGIDEDFPVDIENNHCKRKI
ncbi:hypothetical protein LP123_08155 [Moraxella bovis]|uniref:Uncharacterized protein n=2 Tax=Moraxella bovis TaxID=476 RepID=A0A1S9ZVR9_MORBO|nr:hypothetical protein [Moraxella bovis]AWY20465.1 hypothetical protein DQF64_08170 [Moraxella bovis]OOR87558.1 hypothetical protein B0182_11920 [Moraxella bovis]UYZ76865.1 hypothetical protein LP093_06170 [Moraxella bovis]UYZ77185.1 hypothetical protein LP115_07670 [Moraxella bovis]UYZ85665.1 hypothetical protein LP094_07680 [Moraxella bovis]